MGDINYTHTSALHNPKDALTILPLVLDLINPQSVLDVGCGNGSWLNAAKTLGVANVLGVDGIQVPDEELLVGRHEFLKHDLTTPFNLNKKFDLAISLEVAEHLPEQSATTIVKSLCDHSDVILFSAAIPNQGGQYHYNEQWPAYWQQLFEDNDYFAFDFIRPKIWNDPNLFWWYRQNTMVFVKSESSLIAKFGPKTDKVMSLIHPDLYNRKMNKPKHMNKTELYRLFKILIKESLKKF